MASLRTWLIGILGVATSLPSAAQVAPVNGDFENGLTSWTAGGTANVVVLSASDFQPDLGADWPDAMAVLSTGPGNVPGGNGFDLDGAGGNNEFDGVTLAAPLNFTGSPRVIRFGWAFSSSEEDQPFQFDDVIAVDLDADGNVATTNDRTRLLARSSNKPGGASPFADGPENGSSEITIEAGPNVGGTNLRFGVHERQTLCAGIPATVSGENQQLLLVTLADQGDTAFDSAFLIDDVEVDTVCDADLEQLTLTSGNTVEVKDSGFVFSPAVQRRPAVSDSADAIAFVSTSNLTGDNPSGVEQVYVLEGGVYERIAALGIGVLGRVDGVSIGGDGRYVAISAAPSSTDNLEIYRYDRLTSALLQITDTVACENTNPSTDDAGVRIAFESTCHSITGAGGAMKIVQRQDDVGAGTLRALQGPGACEGANPSVNRASSARYVVFESNCDHSGSNADGNTEIFRYDRNSDSFRQITVTSDSGAATISNYSPRLDGRNSGRYTVFVSTANLTGANADNSSEIFRYDANSGGSITQVTDQSGPQAGIYLGVTVDERGQDMGFARLNVLTGFSDVGYLALTGIEDVVASGTFVGVPQIGVSGQLKVLVFDAPDDFVGQNSDGNSELFRGVVAP